MITIRLAFRHDSFNLEERAGASVRAGFITILSVFFVTVAYVVWHLWRITPGG